MVIPLRILRGKMEGCRRDVNRKEREEKCCKCEYAITVESNPFTTGRVRFVGCIHIPYTGNCVEEIRKCPNEEKERSGKEEDGQEEAD